MLQRQSWRRRLIELGYLVQNLNCLGFFTLSQKVLWRLVEFEYNDSEEEDGKSHGAKHDALVPPAHVARDCAAWFSRCAGSAGRELDITSPFSGGAECGGGGDDDANRLPHREEGDQESTVLW